MSFLSDRDSASLLLGDVRDTSAKTRAHTCSCGVSRRGARDDDDPPVSRTKKKRERERERPAFDSESCSCVS